MAAANGATAKSSTATRLVITFCLILSTLQLALIITHWHRLSPLTGPAAAPTASATCDASAAARTTIPDSPGGCELPTHPGTPASAQPAAPPDDVVSAPTCASLDNRNSAIIRGAATSDLDGAARDRGAGDGARGWMADDGRDRRRRRRFPRCPRCGIIRCDDRTCRGSCRSQGKRFNCQRRRDTLARARGLSPQAETICDLEVVRLGSILFGSTVDYRSPDECGDLRGGGDGDAEQAAEYYGECDGGYSGDDADYADKMCEDGASAGGTECMHGQTGHGACT